MRLRRLAKLALVAGAFALSATAVGVAHAPTATHQAGVIKPSLSRPAK